jgi:hypothetical protein
MSAQFWPCPGCSRHVKRGDAICPFCGATPSVEIRPTRVLAGRLSRAALFAAGAVGATTACTTATSTPFYGAAVIISETEDSSASDAPSEAAADAGDASASDAPSEAAPDVADASATPPTDSASTSDDSSSAPDVPMTVASYGSIFPPDE